jgi:hypothetical protein
MLPSMIWVAKKLYFFNCLLDGAHTTDDLFTCHATALSSFYLQQNQLNIRLLLIPQ